MPLAVSTSVPFADVEQDLHDSWAGHWTATVRKAADAGKGEFRRQLSTAFPGTMAPYLVTADVWPGRGVSLGAVMALEARGEKAATILEAWSASTTTIRGRDGLWLAIPAPACPRGSNGRHLTPVEAEAFFNAELQLVPAPGGRSAFLVLDLIDARSGRGYRAPTAGRLAAGRRPMPTVLFVLTPQATLHRRLDPDAALNAAVASVDGT